MLTFHHLRDGKPSIIKRVTNGKLAANYGPDSGRALVVSLEAGDRIVFRPKGTRQRITLEAFDAYAFALRCHALALAREKQAAKAASRKGRGR